MIGALFGNKIFAHALGAHGCEVLVFMKTRLAMQMWSGVQEGRKEGEGQESAVTRGRGRPGRGHPAAFRIVTLHPSSTTVCSNRDPGPANSHWVEGP